MTRDATLVLIRHGRTTWVDEGRFQGSADVPLSARGRAQAAALGAHLALPHAPPGSPLPARPPSVIRHSPLTRAAETAVAIAQALPTPAVRIVDPDLHEIAQGAWEGLRHDEVRSRWPTELARWRDDPLHHRAPGGESLEDASVRAARAAERILGDVASALRPAREAGALAVNVPAGEPPGPGAAPVVDEHDPWSITVAHDGLLRLVLLRLLDLPLERYWVFPFALCAITVIELRDGRARLRAHNLEGHLGELAG